VPRCYFSCLVSKSGCRHLLYKTTGPTLEYYPIESIYTVIAAIHLCLQIPLLSFVERSIWCFLPHVMRVHYTNLLFSLIENSVDSQETQAREHNRND
jgi:hypothetical protein